MLLSCWSARFSRVWPTYAGPRAAEILSLQPRVLRLGAGRGHKENDREEIVRGKSVVQGYRRADSGAVFGNRSATGFAHAFARSFYRAASRIRLRGNRKRCGSGKGDSSAERQGFPWPRAGGE